MPHYDLIQLTPRVLSTINVGNQFAFIVDATVAGANTFNTLRQRVADNIANSTRGYEAKQIGQKILRGLDIGGPNSTNILSDANLAGKTTVTQLRALCTAFSPTLPSDYTQDLPE